MRRVLLLLAFALFCVPVWGANQTRVQLQTQVNSVPWTNGNQLITGAQLQNLFQNFLDSVFVATNPTLLTCGATACSLGGDLTVTGALTAAGTASGPGFTGLFASPPPLGSVTPNTGVHTTLNVTGATTLSGLLTATGQIAYNPVTNSAAGVIPGLFEQYSATGTVGAATSAVVNALNLTTDTLAINDPGTLVLQSFNDTNFGGSAARGGRIMAFSSLTQTAITEATHTFRGYLGDQGNVNSLSGDGGGVGTEKGDYYGRWGTATLGASATNVKSLQTMEFDIDAGAGSSVLYKAPILIAHVPLASNGVDTVQGSIVDTNIWMFNLTGNVGAKVGILAGRPDGFGGLGISPTGTFIATANEVATLGSGIDLTGGGNTTITNFAWKSPGANQTTSIDGGGNFRGNSFNIPSGAAYAWGASLGMIALNTDLFLDDFVPGDFVMRTTGAAEVFRLKSTGIMQIKGASGIAANGTVATAMSNLGPAGSHTTIQEWLVVQNSAGTTRWLPMF